eukprot:jgi/Ulvmu1/4784/UM020_0069.1
MAVAKKKGAKHAKAKKKAKKQRAADAGANTDITGGIKAVADVGAAKVPQLASKGRARIQRARTAEREQRRLHVPVVDNSTEEPPPLLVAVHGPPGVGKTTLIRCLIKHYTRQSVGELRGPVTVVSSKKRRLTFVECPTDICGMIDVAKAADVVLLLIDGEFGFEMETFEFLMLLQQHGMPKVIGVLNHLDGFKDNKKLKKVKKELKTRFDVEVSHGAKLFYLSGIRHGKYLKREVLNLARFISTARTRPINWRLAHPYLLADRFEDITNKEVVRKNPRCDRTVVLFGYLRGCNLRLGQRVHIAGVDDFSVDEIEQFPDPCPLPDTIKKRGLNEQERRVYAPMSDVGGLLYDKDATYIDIPDWKLQYTRSGISVPAEAEEGEAMVRELQDVSDAVDEQLQASAVQLFTGGEAMQRPAGDSEGDGESDDGGSSGDDGGEDSDDGASDWSSDGEDGNEAPMVDVRMRRKALFAGGAHGDGKQEGGPAEAEEDSSSEDADGDADEGNTARWRGRMLLNQSKLFSVRAGDIKRAVYGESAVYSPADAVASPDHDLSSVRDITNAVEHSGDSDDEELFQLKRPGDSSTMGAAAAKLVRGGDAVAMDGMDGIYAWLDEPANALSRWIDASEAVESLRHRVVTGGEEAFDDARRRGLAEGEGQYSGDVDEVFGEFEDIETGQVFSGSKDEVTQAAVKAIKEAKEEEKREELRARKLAKKAAFDSAYDQGGGARAAAGDDSPDDGGDERGEGEPKQDDATKKRKGLGWARGKEEETFFDHMKKDIADRQAATRAELDGMDAATRQALEGFRPGAYVRMRISQAPCELVDCFEPSTPLLIGGLAQGEEKVGFMHLRFKRHRWFPKILKNRDPLVLSAGWRRFQTLPVFSQEDNNGRHRMLKYTPEHMHCRATAFGPLVPPQTGIIAVQSLAGSLSSWRISGTAVVMELDARFDIMKKLKLVGHPYRIERHTAFIKDMFTSEVEVSKFLGASLRTVSGIRGTVKKAIRPGASGATAGSFRGAFEDKLVHSDIVMLKAWVAVDVPRFFNPVTNLLARPVKAVRESKERSVHKRTTADDVAEEALVVAVEGAGPGAEVQFMAAYRFKGPRAGMKFCLGPRGLGYYTDLGPNMSYSGAAAGGQSTAAHTDTLPDQPGAETGWVGARTVAQLRRGLGVGAPREQDSLYKPVDRVERLFPALRVPKALQQSLPFASKPKVEPRRQHSTLEQRRAVPLEKPEKKMYTLMQQLNAIRNDKASKRRDQKKKSHERRMKRHADEQAWREELSKDERKKRYMQQTAEANRNAKRARA